jgi:hypothetical protein
VNKLAADIAKVWRFCDDIDQGERRLHAKQQDVGATPVVQPLPDCVRDYVHERPVNDAAGRTAQTLRSCSTPDRGPRVEMERCI